MKGREKGGGEMKTVLIILTVLVGFVFMGFLAPAIAAALLALLFFACDFTVLGVLTIIVGVIAEIVWIYSFYADAVGPAGSGQSYDYDDDVEHEGRGNQFNWPMLFGITFLVDKMEHKGKK